MEHVHHVASISYTIAHYLGLNTELTQAIALSHDIGHAPFGHEGETRLNDILTDNKTEKSEKLFWHERNGLYVVDKIATLKDDNNIHQNFDLTYAVRDGIVCHCGEIDENGLRPRTENIDLYKIQKAGDAAPYTWEACVVKISDKIAYLGRDIEDAVALKVLSKTALARLHHLVKQIKTVNNTALIHGFIVDLCKNSTLESGLSFSEETFKLATKIKNFNYEYIYKHPRIEFYKKYVEDVINTIYDFLSGYGQKVEILQSLKESEELFPLLAGGFRKWLIKYSNAYEEERVGKYENAIIYDLKNAEDCKRAIVDFIAGMSDNFAIKAYEEIVAF
jgi:dGTPase